MDEALLALTLDDEDDQPLIIPNLPNFSSAHRNEFSLIGRTLNPKRQIIRNLLRDMPRKWQKVGRVTGVALGDDKFQFIFKHKHDLEEVLEKGAQTYNDWSIVLDRWCASPPDNYLQQIPLWVQIWNVPLDYRIIDTLKFIADPLGRILEVPFDPDKTQLQQYFRIRISFDVNSPLKRYRSIVLTDGSTSRVHFKYERIQKKCILCQRLTHEMELCPYNQKQSSEKSELQHGGSTHNKDTIISQSDPLYGIIQEDQLGPDPNTGRPKIASSVLQSLREYILAAPHEDKDIITSRIKHTMQSLDQDKEAKKTLLQLEPPPLIHKDLTKGKGIVFEYDKSKCHTPVQSKLMNSAIQAAQFNTMSSSNQNQIVGPLPRGTQDGIFLFGAHSLSASHSPINMYLDAAGSSGLPVHKKKTKSIVKQQKPTVKNKPAEGTSTQTNPTSLGDKRKAESDGNGTASTKKQAPS